MPRRNTRNRKFWNSDFHVYNRQRVRDLMFIDDEDRRMFLWMMQRYLSTATHLDSRGRPYRSLRGDVQLLSFALMANHFHLVLRQLRHGGLESFMNGVLSSYVRYFNKRHGGEGALFRGEYRAAPKPDLKSRMNAVSYVHDNHGPDCRCEFCSHRFYVSDPDDVPSWIAAEAGLRLFGGEESYLRYRDLRAGIKSLTD